MEVNHVRKHKLKKTDAGKEKKRKIAGWSTKMLKTATRHECEDTKEMVQWRSIDGLWKELCGTMEEV